MTHDGDYAANDFLEHDYSDGPLTFESTNPVKCKNESYLSLADMGYLTKIKPKFTLQE